jgi:hypothetical protein
VQPQSYDCLPGFGDKNTDASARSSLLTPAYRHPDELAPSSVFTDFFRSPSQNPFVVHEVSILQHFFRLSRVLLLDFFAPVWCCFFPQPNCLSDNFLSQATG